MPAKYTDSQLSGMAVNPEIKGRMVDAYPHLGDLLHKVELTHSDDNDKLLRYLAWVYDPNSPMVKAHPDIRTRKDAAASYSGYKGKADLTKLIVLCLREVYRSREWTLIISYERAFDELTERVNEPIATTKTVVVKSDEGTTLKEVPLEDEDVLKAVERKSKLLMEMERELTKLPDLYLNFYAGDEQLQQAATARRDYSPESVAGRIDKSGVQ